MPQLSQLGGPAVASMQSSHAVIVASEASLRLSRRACATLLAPAVPSFALLPPAAVPGGGVSSSRAASGQKLSSTQVRTYVQIRYRYNYLSSTSFILRVLEGKGATNARWGGGRHSANPEIPQYNLSRCPVARPPWAVAGAPSVRKPSVCSGPLHSGKTNYIFQS